MLVKMSDKIRQRLRRKHHIRKSVYGTADRPRMTVFRSNKNLYAQVVNDDENRVLTAISTMEGDYKTLKPTVADAEKLGEAFGARLKDKKIGKVVFDRNGYLYHGVVKALADGTRKAGIDF